MRMTTVGCALTRRAADVEIADDLLIRSRIHIHPSDLWLFNSLTVMPRPLGCSFLCRRILKHL